MRRLFVLLVLSTSTAMTCVSDSPEAAGLCAENSVATTIADNHPNGFHTLEIPVADVTEGVEKTQDVQGNNTGHGHTVTVSSADFAALDAGTVVMLTSSDTGAVGMDHTHEVTLSRNP